jgi:hypothetical protein
MARNELDITYYPKGAKDLNDGIAIGHLVKVLIGESRRRDQALIKKTKLTVSQTCGRCNRSRGPYQELDLHHKKPLWAYAMELVMADLPQTHDQYTAMWESMALGRIKLGKECHEAHNAEALCRKCHTRAEVEAFEAWKKHFIGRGRIVFGNKIADHQRYLSEKIEYMPKWR